MKIISILIAVFSFTFMFSLQAQDKRNFQWVIGYDTSTIDNVGNAILLDFNNNDLAVLNINSVNGFWMEGANTSKCDNNGNLLFYSNGCYIVNAKNEIMMNGDSINP